MNEYRRNYLRILTSQRLPDGTVAVLPDDTLESIDSIEVTPDGRIKYKCKMRICVSKWRFFHGSTA